MTITSADIKLLESERMTDSTDGGGRMTARVIPDGVNGNIFPKVSRLDAVYGRVNLRKIYGKVDTANTDTYAGAHLIITDPPDNEKVSVCAFSTGSFFDTRTEAKDRIESYVFAGPEARMRLYGRQPAGAKSILVYQRKGEALPDIGDVYALVQMNSNRVVYREQYIRIEEVQSELRDFEDDKGIYTYAVLSIRLTAPLEFEFFGPDTPQRSSTAERLGLVRTTTVADIARYYGVRPLAEAVAANALEARVDSVFTPLVPTTSREVAVSLATIGEAANYVPTGLNWDGPAFLNSGASLHFPSPIKPGSCTLTGTGAAYPARDDGNGGFVFSDGISRPLVTVDYANGVATMPNTGNLGTDYAGLGGFATCNAESAAPGSQPNHTFAREITLATTGTVFSEVLDPPPAPGTLIIDYRALGKWYRLRDDGAGVLAGEEPSYGTGTVDYISGAVVATLGTQPDNETSVLFSWGSTLHYESATTDADTKIRREITLGHTPIAAGTLVLTTFWYPNATPRTLTFTSDTATATGMSATLNRATGKVVITYTGTEHEDASIPLSASYSYETAATGSPQPVTETVVTPINYSASQILLGKAVRPGSVRVIMPLRGTMPATWGFPFAVLGDILLLDDGTGNLRVAPNQYLFSGQSKAAVEAGAIFGSLNYSTGTIDVNGTVPIAGTYYKPGLGTSPAEWVTTSGTAARDAGATPSKSATTTFTPAGVAVDQNAVTETFDLPAAPYKFDLTKTRGQGVVPGSVVFKIDNGGWHWTFARQDLFNDRAGQVMRNLNISNGSGTLSGSINYSNGEVSLGDVYGMESGKVAVTVLACMVYQGDYSTDQAFFRTTGSPVKPSSLYVRAMSLEGDQLTGTADVNGVISGDLIEGLIVQNTGVTRVRFGEWQPVSGNTGQPWYDADNIDPNDASRVWKPTLVNPGTLTYSCVLSTSIALNASVLGLDPVRLPLDGKVPIYRGGDVGVIHNTQSFNLPNNPAGGSTHNVGRTGLSDLWLIDQDKVRIDPALYTVNPEAGTLTFASSINLAGYVQPLIARHRISDMVLITGVSIDGRLEFGAPVSQAYPQAGSYISSALLFGDLYARVANVFDQQTWTGAWSDSLIGDGANAQYNDILYPITTRNDGAVTERWRIQFTSGTAFQCIGEGSGFIANGTTGADFAPVNPLTNKPYFTIQSGGWGSGWAIGNQLRFNTHAAAAPILLARTILPGAPPTEDSTDIQFRGDVDA